jgi:hypothetical protein
MSLPPELDFLSSFYEDPFVAIRSANWLLSDFDENVWTYSFGFKKPKTIDWNIKIDDQSSLIDPKNRELYQSFKYFLAASTSPRAQPTRANEFNRAIHIIDFLLINSTHFNLSKHGLAGLGRDHLKSILSEISSDKDTSESIYGWSKRVSRYCLELASKTNQEDIQRVLVERPELSAITPYQAESNTLDIPLEMIPQARAALYLNNYYVAHREKGYSPDSIKISGKIYRDTLKGRIDSKPYLEILIIHDDNQFVRERLPLAVTTAKRERIGDSALRDYKSTLYSLGVLHEIGFPAPSPADLTSVRNFILKTDAAGRFRTLPSRVVFGAVRNAIEFHIKYGEALVDDWCKAALHCKEKGISSSELKDEQLQNLVSPKLQEMGVTSLGLSRRAARTDFALRLKGSKQEYFSNLRANKGLIELLRIYIGGVQIVVGALMARRVGELIDLHTITCLDDTEQWLIFHNRKSTQHLFGVRQTEARPIEPIASRMIKNLVRLQKNLKGLGFIPELRQLFSSPSIHGDFEVRNAYVGSYNCNLDFFCDYFETETNNEGKRYYIRQHQLRRFFAMLFFYSSSFGGLETLQWMLGHTDVKHVWHYITESMDGSTLRGAKAQYAAEALHSGDIHSFESLGELIKSRYGTNDFTVVDTDELEDYITDLMDEGSVEIEPEFFEDNEGQRFKVVAKVKRIVA